MKIKTTDLLPGDVIKFADMTETVVCVEPQEPPSVVVKVRVYTNQQTWYVSFQTRSHLSHAASIALWESTSVRSRR